MSENKLITVDNGSPNYRGFIAPELNENQYVEWSSAYERSSKSSIQLKELFVQNTFLFSKVKDVDQLWVTNSKTFLPPNVVDVRMLKELQYAFWSVEETIEKNFTLASLPVPDTKEHVIYCVDSDSYEYYGENEEEDDDITLNTRDIVVQSPIKEKPFQNMYNGSLSSSPIDSIGVMFLTVLNEMTAVVSSIAIKFMMSVVQKI